MTGLPPLRNVNANSTDFEHITDMPGSNNTGPIENVDFYQTVTVGYPDTMGIPVLQGRALQDVEHDPASRATCPAAPRGA